MQVKRLFIRVAALAAILLVLSMLVFPTDAMAHNVSKRDASFVESNQGAAIAAFVYLGAKHMVTGYDHIAFLVGVIFFLYKLKDIVQYVSLFTLGHSITLLVASSEEFMPTRTRSTLLSGSRWSTRLSITWMVSGGF